MVRWPVISFASLLLISLATTPSLAQSSLLKRFDKNGDGVVRPEEVPERMRSIFRRLVERAGLDPDQPVRLDEIEAGVRRKVQQKLAEEEGRPVVVVTGRRLRLFIRWPGQQQPPTEVKGRGIPPIASRRAGSSSRASRLPSPYDQYDRNKDGQIGLYEWPRDRIREFLELDKNRDGFLTPRELRPTNPNRSGPREERAAERENPEPSANPEGPPPPGLRAQEQPGAPVIVVEEKRGDD